MRAQRPKPAEWNKPFRIFEKRDQFNKIDGADQEMIISRAEIQKKPEVKKEEIVKPKIEVIAVPNRGVNTKGIPLNYIRLSAQLNLPRADKYQLSEVDHTFLVANENKYLFGGKKVLTVDLLERCFVELELMTGKDTTTIPKSLKPRFKTFLQEHLDVVSKMEKFDEFVELIYNRWRGRRDQLKNPLLRQLWRPNTDDTSHYLAFRPRQKDKEKRPLRRINKSNEDDTRFHIETLLKQMEKSRDIADRVSARQSYKLALFNLDLQKFNIEVKGFKNEPLFVKEVDKKDVVKLREDYQKLKNDFEIQREAQQLEVANNTAETASIVAQDSKAAVCNFVANLSRLANQVGIDYDSLFSDNLRPVAPALTVDKPSKLVADAPSAPLLTATTVCKFNLSQLVNKEQRFLERNFSPIYHEAKPERMPEQTNPYFILKHRDLCRNYYFQDDEEEGKDIKRSIAANFKKYLASRT